MDAKKKKVVIATVSILAVVGILVVAYKQWGGGTPLFGPGKVDREAKLKRTFILRN